MRQHAQEYIITSNKGLFELKFSELWNYRDLLWLLVKRDFISFYKQTVLGPVWFFIQPLFTMLTYTFVFGNLAGLSTDGIPKPLFYLTGIVTWTYFADCLNKTSSVFKDNANIFGKVYFPRLIMPLSIVFSNLTRFSIQFMLLLFLIVYYWLSGADIQFSWYIMLIPFLVACMAAQGLGLGMVISALTTKYRDLIFLITFGVQLLMYATTVVYPLSSLTGKLKMIVALNPMTYVIEGMRKALLGNASIQAENLLYLFCVSTAMLLIGVLVFNKVEKDFIDTI